MIKKTFYFDIYTPNFNKAFLKLINRMGWEIVSRKELGTVEKTVKIEFCIPEDDVNIFKFILEDLF